MNTEELLKPCPFCGGKAILTLIGNDHTRRKAKIKCKSCNIEQVTGALYHPLAWCEEQAIKTWNQRTESPDLVIKCIIYDKNEGQYSVLIRDNTEKRSYPITITDTQAKELIDRGGWTEMNTSDYLHIILYS